MARPSRKGGKTRVTKARKARSSAKTKRPIGPAIRLKRSPVSGNELNEAREQQAATADILKVIASSPADVQPVFETIGQRAEKLCNAEISVISMLNDDQIHLVAIHGISKRGIDAVRRAYPMRLDGETLTARALRSKGICHVPDVLADPLYQTKDAARAGKYRAGLAVPMIRERKVIGAIFVARKQPGLFTDAQVQLLRMFADQALIAIENTRLFNETQGALERQTATADILKVIASSPSDVQPVFDAIASSANRLIGGYSTTVYRFIDGIVHLKAFTPVTPEADEVLKNTFPMPVENLPQQNVVRGETDQVPDTEAGSEFQIRLGRARGFRSIMLTPLLYQGRAIGMIATTRREPGRFADQHVQLLQTFADQAVIAIENTRLFNETKETLERQTATAEILNVIASSPTRIEPVLKAIVESACELCESFDAAVLLKDGDDLRHSAHHGPIPIGLEKWPLNRRWVAGRVFLDKVPIHIHDFRSAEGDEFPEGRQMSHQMGHRTLLCVPMLREGEAIGVIGLRRTEVRPFSDKQVALLQTFADQAVIAIGNVRLFEEVQAKTRDLTESLDQQIATGEVLKVISHSAFDLHPVFDAIAENSVKLCHAERAFIFRFDGHFLRAISSFNVGPDVKRFVDQNPIALGRHSISARAGLERRTVHATDIQADPEYAYAVRDVNLIRTILAVPMLKSDELVGVITIYRLEVKPFTDKQVSLVETFAAQAVIAVENTRLINELKQSLDDLRTAQDRLVQTEKLASLGQLTAGIAHEIKNPLNFVNNFSGMSAELIGELKDVVTGLSLDPDTHADIKELTDMLSANLEKIVQHGQRADAIVKSMLLHSGQSSGEHRLSDINALVDESLNRAYYGERAETRGFTIKLEKSFDPAAGEVDLFPREISRAILNLISNGFYAATRRKEMEGDSYEPILLAATRNLGDRVEIRIRDNGSGIPAEVKEKMFDPFFTTKPAGEGTGLGLSITHDIIVKQHGGSIEVDTQPGEFAEITLVLPRAGALLSGRR